MLTRASHHLTRCSLRLAGILAASTGCGADPAASTDSASTFASTTDTPTSSTGAPTTGPGTATTTAPPTTTTTTTTTEDPTSGSTTASITTTTEDPTSSTTTTTTTTTTSDTTTDTTTTTDTETGEPACARWERTYGGAALDYGNSVVHLPDGGFAIAGRIASKGAGGEDMWLLRLDEEGELLWDQTYGTADWESASGLALAPDGGFLLVGTRISQATGVDWWIVRTDSEGVELWDRTFSTADDDRAFAAIAVQAGGFAVAGSRDRIGLGTGRFWLIRLADDGATLWEKIYGDLGSEQLAYGLVEYPGDGFAVAGTAAEDFWLVRTDLEGNLLWDRSYDFGAGHYDRATALVRMPDDGLALAGFTSNGSPTDYWIVRTDFDGEPLWTNHYDRGTTDVANDVAVLADGGLVVVGSSHTESDVDLWIVRTDAAGAVVWERSYGGAESDLGQAVVALPGSDLAFVGYTYSKGAGAGDVWALRTSHTGLLDCE